MMKDKKIYFVICAIIVVAIIVVLTIVIKNRNSNIEPTKILDINEVIEIRDIGKSKVEIIKSKEETIASKYTLGSSVYVVNAIVQFDKIEGKVLYVRESRENMNIYQTKYKIDEDDSISEQVRKYMQIFMQMIENYISVREEKPIEVLYGESTTSAPIPIEESIYLENRLYSLTYNIQNEERESEEYDINFYRIDNELICEFVNKI